MGQQLRVGVVGASPERGWARSAHMPALRALPRFRVHAVATTLAETAAAAAQEYGADLAFADGLELARHPEVDVVSVCVKSRDHELIVRTALDHGKHVYCEWPLAVDAEQAARLAALAARSSGRHVVGLQGVRSPGVRRLRDIVAAGRIGRVLAVSVVVGTSGFGSPSVARARAHTVDAGSGTTLLSVVGGHALSCVTAALGPLAEVSAHVDTQTTSTLIAETGERVAVTAPDQVAISGRLASGATVGVTLLGGHPDDFRIRVVGSAGSVLIGPAVPGVPCQIAEWDIRVGDEAVPSERPPGVGRLYQELADAIDADRPAEPGFAAAAAMHNVLAAVQRASDTGVRQTVLDWGHV